MAKRSLEERIQRMEAIHEIQNLMSKYAYWKMAELHEKIPEMFANKIPGVRAEICNFGVWEGTEGLLRLFVDIRQRDGEESRIGLMRVLTLTTPVIEVAGDGKTAKGVWISPGCLAIPVDGKHQAQWAWCKYGADFIKEDGEWKFWHLHVYAIFQTPYDKSWVEMKPAANAYTDLPDELKPDRPSTYRWEYSPTGKTENVPAPPEPYEIFDEGTAY